MCKYILLIVVSFTIHPIIAQNKTANLRPARTITQSVQRAAQCQEESLPAAQSVVTSNDNKDDIFDISMIKNLIKGKYTKDILLLIAATYSGCKAINNLPNIVKDLELVVCHGVFSFLVFNQYT